MLVVVVVEAVERLHRVERCRRRRTRQTSASTSTGRRRRELRGRQRREHWIGSSGRVNVEKRVPEPLVDEAATDADAEADQAAYGFVLANFVLVVVVVVVVILLVTRTNAKPTHRERRRCIGLEYIHILIADDGRRRVLELHAGFITRNNRIVAE